jgi:transcriptional regulator with XRE-family HTH domain
MEKTKLISVRMLKGFTQQQVADYLCMDVSNYNRKEKGAVKIRKDEWERLSEFLKVSIEDIFESEESHCFIFKDNSTGNYLGTNHIYMLFLNIFLKCKESILKS